MHFQTVFSLGLLFSLFLLERVVRLEGACKTGVSLDPQESKFCYVYKEIYIFSDSGGFFI